jgi:hypothetical protein
MSDSYDDYEAKIQLAEQAWEKRVDEMVKTEHDKQVTIAQAYERGWNAALAHAAIAQQKPVAWMYTSQWKSNERFITTYQSELTTYKADKVWPLYTAPQKKEWVGLTDEEIVEIAATPAAIRGSYVHSFAQAIEAKLRDKNT